MSFYGDPDELLRLAGRLGGAASRARGEARSLGSRSEAVAWQSTAAMTMRQTVGMDASTLRDAAGGIDDAAGLLRRHAAEVRERVEQIRAVEEAVTGWFADQARRAQSLADEALDIVLDAFDPPWTGWRWTPANLPAPGSAAWLDVGDYLRRQGVM